MHWWSFQWLTWLVGLRVACFVASDLVFVGMGHLQPQLIIHFSTSKPRVLTASHDDNPTSYNKTSKAPNARVPSHAISRCFPQSASPPYTFLTHMWHSSLVGWGWFDWGDDLWWAWSRHGPLPPSSMTFNPNQVGNLGPKFILY